MSCEESKIIVYTFRWSSYILRRPQNFEKPPPYFWLALHRTKVRWSNFVAFSEYMNFTYLMVVEERVFWQQLQKIHWVFSVLQCHSFPWFSYATILDVGFVERDLGFLGDHSYITWAFVWGRGALCVEMGSTWTSYRNQDATVAINDLLCMKNAGAQIAMDFS